MYIIFSISAIFVQFILVVRGKEITLMIEVSKTQVLKSRNHQTSHDLILSQYFIHDTILLWFLTLCNMHSKLPVLQEYKQNTTSWSWIESPWVVITDKDSFRLMATCWQSVCIYKFFKSGNECLSRREALKSTHFLWLSHYRSTCWSRRQLCKAKDNQWWMDFATRSHLNV